MKFTTKDSDNDASANNCAINRNGAWWYRNCFDTNLNGYNYNSKTAPEFKGILYWHWKRYEHSLKSVRMSVKAQ